jgi:nitrate reductase gamma subunit
MEKFRKNLVIIGGITSLLWGLFHVSFWFAPFPIDWKNELVKLTEMNSNIMQMLNIGISVFLLAFGFIMLFYRREILNSALGKALPIVFALF